MTTHDATAQPGHLYGVGVGPGDPGLITLRAASLIASADVIAYHRAAHRESTARSIAADHLRDGVIEEALVYPVTTGTTDHPGGYYGALADFYDECAERFRASPRSRSQHRLPGRGRPAVLRVVHVCARPPP